MAKSQVSQYKTVSNKIILFNVLLFFRHQLWMQAKNQL